MKTGNKKTNKGNSALRAASVARSATAQKRAHSGSELPNTGTNISYEGATAPGAGGSAGTGQASGKEAVDEKVSSISDYAHNRKPQPKNKAADKETEDDDTDENLDWSDDIEEIDEDDEEELE